MFQLLMTKFTIQNYYINYSGFPLFQLFILYL